MGQGTVRRAVGPGAQASGREPLSLGLRAQESILDFTSDPEAVQAFVEAHWLAEGHRSNPAFAVETALIDPLPHQRLAVYEQMLAQPHLRFLLADDAGAGKTIMAGLYIREMLSRQLVRRVLIVPPAGLVGNWYREMLVLFRLRFTIVDGGDAAKGNPFTTPDSDLVIAKIDTLAGERMFGRLREPSVEPYDLVVFDEAHKLSAWRDPDGTFRATDRYRLGEALAGVPDLSRRWRLRWSARHLLLLTATPHMGKDDPYFFLWRLLDPLVLPTREAFAVFPPEARAGHFIRRTKEEMVTLDGSPLYPTRVSDTLSFDLSTGSPSEQELYDKTSEYIHSVYNRARILNRSAARFAMSIFQRRMASSTWALLRSLERRRSKLDELIEAIRSGRITEDELRERQHRLDRLTADPFEESTADEEETVDGKEASETGEDVALGGVVAVSLAELMVERCIVDELCALAEAVLAGGHDSKFEKLREVLKDPALAGTKLIIFTEHRDTLDFLVRRFEALGFTGRIAAIHGGLGWEERERQVEFFRTPAENGGADFLVATDAAGEGINLQFCWLMINYDIPWNPARLEQRMGRIHRYKQKHDPVVIVNLVAGKTREGRVLKTLLDKLEKIRRELGSDKVFDVVGRVLGQVSIKQYLERALGGVDAAAEIDQTLTAERVRNLAERERALYGTASAISGELPRLRDELQREVYRRLLPGYVRRFVERAAPLLGLRIEGDLDGEFSLRAEQAGAMDAIWRALDLYPAHRRQTLSVVRPEKQTDAVFLHPGEAVFDALAGLVKEGFHAAARKGAVFVDPTATEPFLIHLGAVSVEQAPAPGASAGSPAKILEHRLLALRQNSSGEIQEIPVEALILLRPGGPPPAATLGLVAAARGLTDIARDFASDMVLQGAVERHRARVQAGLGEREEFLRRGFDFQDADLAERRVRIAEKARAGNAAAQAELVRIKEQQAELALQRDRALADLREEAQRIQPGRFALLAHALVAPSGEPEDRMRFDAEVESIAVRVAWAFEESFGSHVSDVSTPPLARAAGLSDWPGFDLLSRRPGGEELAIEVKGRAAVGAVELKENEWAKACNLRDRYWLYVVYDCGTAAPRLLRVQDPFGRLIARRKGGVLIDEKEIVAAAESEVAK